MPISLFPEQALPNVIHLIEHFNCALDLEIKYYEFSQDQAEFQRVLENLSNDLYY